MFYQPLRTRPEEKPVPCKTVAFLQAGWKSFDLCSEGWVTNSWLQAALLGCERVYRGVVGGRTVSL